MALQSHRYDLSPRAASASDCAREPQFRSITSRDLPADRGFPEFRADTLLDHVVSSRQEYFRDRRTYRFGCLKLTAKSNAGRAGRLRNAGERPFSRYQRREWRALLAASGNTGAEQIVVHRIAANIAKLPELLHKPAYS